MPIKPLKKPKSKSKTHIELGYERDPNTGRIIKPGTRKFNEKVAIHRDLKEPRIAFYKRRAIENPTEVNIQKLVDARLQLKQEIGNMERDRKYDLDVIDAKRKRTLKKRQIEYKISKIDSLLLISNNKTVSLFLKELANDIYKYKVRKAKEKQKGKLIKIIPSLKGVSKVVIREFYREFDKAVSPTELKNMTSRDAVILVDKICKGIKRREFI